MLERIVSPQEAIEFMTKIIEPEIDGIIAYSERSLGIKSLPIELESRKNIRDQKATAYYIKHEQAGLSITLKYDSAECELFKKNRKIGEISTIYVKPEERNGTLGYLILQHCINELSQQNDIDWIYSKTVTPQMAKLIRYFIKKKYLEHEYYELGFFNESVDFFIPLNSENRRKIADKSTDL